MTSVMIVTPAGRGDTVTWALVSLVHLVMMHHVVHFSRGISA
jgi:hypothetical protein